ncbi:unnamed protein product [Tilletia controversa]|nr:unnamed protein product [Tilletia controversa]
MANFNFTGSTAPQRNINLGGASAGATLSQAQLAAAARAERAQREKHRRKEASACLIQSTWRSHRIRLAQLARWHPEADSALTAVESGAHAQVEVERAVRLVAYATGAGFAARNALKESQAEVARRRVRAQLSSADVGLLVRACKVMILTPPQPLIVAPTFPPRLRRYFLDELLAALFALARQPPQDSSLAASASLLQSLLTLLQRDKTNSIAVHLLDDGLYSALAALLASVPEEQKASPSVKLVVDVALLPFRTLTPSKFGRERQLALENFIVNILTMRLLPNRITLRSLAELVVYSPFDDIIGAIISFSESPHSSVLSSPHLLANVMAVGGGAKRVSLFKIGAQLRAYLDALRLMQNALPAHVFLGPSKRAKADTTKGNVKVEPPPANLPTETAATPEDEDEDSHGLFDDDRSRARAERRRHEARAAAQHGPEASDRDAVLDMVTYKRILSLPSDKHLTAILNASTKFSASTRPALCAFLCSITTAGWPVAVRERVLGSVIYVGSQSATGESGSQQQQVGGFIRELWRGYIRGGTLARMLSAGPEAALKTLQTSQDETTSRLDATLRAIREALQREWPALVLICELYSRALLTMGDAEFMPDNSAYEAATSSSNVATTSTSSSSSLSLRNPLSIDEVVSLSGLLRNLVFAMFWYEGSSAISNTSSPGSAQTGPIGFADLYLRGFKLKLGDLRALLTKVLQQLYTRDSRRHFSPAGHWEMLSKNDLQAFINTVILEEQALVEGAGALGSNDFEGSRATRRRDQEQAEMMDLVDEDEENDDPRRQAAQRGLSESMEPARNLPIWHRLRNQPRSGSAGRITASMMAFLSPRLGVLNNIPFVIPFDVRVEIFRQFIRNDAARSDIDRFDPNQRGVRIRRGHVAEDGFRGLHRLGPQLKRRIQIQFIDQFGQVEAGIDGGGLFKEFLTSLVREAFDTNRGLWSATSDQAIYPNPHSYAQQAEQLEWYTFLGRVLGKAIYDGILVDIKFASFFLSKWLGKQSYLDDLASLDSLDPELAKGLNFVLRAYTGDFEDLALNFTVTDEEFGVSTTTELVPGGAQIPVTRENRLEYVYRVSHYRLSDQIEKQSAAFFSGLSEMVDPRWLRMMNREELRVLVSGTEAPIDVDDLRANTVYGGYHEQDLTIQYFWDALKSFDPQMRKAFLKFVTSCPSPPLLGFAHLSPKFAIRNSGTDEARLPTASTCVNLLKLPAYSTPEQVAAKLRYVCTIEVGFDLS